MYIVSNNSNITWEIYIWSLYGKMEVGNKREVGTIPTLFPLAVNGIIKNFILVISDYRHFDTVYEQ